MSAAVEVSPVSGRSRLRAVVDLLVPWSDARAEARAKAETRELIRSVKVERERTRVVRVRSETILDERDRIRRGYRTYGDGFRR